MSPEHPANLDAGNPCRHDEDLHLRLDTLDHCEGGAAHPVRLVFVTHACDERVFTGCLGRMKDFDRARAACDDAPFGKANPLTGILSEQRVTLCPIFGFVLLPIRMDPLGNLRRQTFDQASHGLSRRTHVTIIHGLNLKSKGESEETGRQKNEREV